MLNCLPYMVTAIGLIPGKGRKDLDGCRTRRRQASAFPQISASHISSGIRVRRRENGKAGRAESRRTRQLRNSTLIYADFVTQISADPAFF